jgi:light-regulated signal transduction histidine kinase (bacteriophytochrome)
MSEKTVPADMGSTRCSPGKEVVLPAGPGVQESLPDRSSGDSSVRDKLQDELAERRAEIDSLRQEIEAVYYAIAHDLRAPIRSINSCSQALRNESPAPLTSQSRELLHRLHNAASYMATLVDKLLELSRVGRATMNTESLNLSAMAKSILFDLQKSEPGRLADLSISPNIEAHGDRQLMKIALEHLLANAWKFSSKCLRTEIEFGSAANDGGAPVYFVRDHGAGFDMAQRHKLFVPFQRLHSRLDYPGIGVGLAIVQRILHRHGGRIWAESENGNGTTFFFTLSRYPAD